MTVARWCSVGLFAAHLSQEITVMMRAAGAFKQCRQRREKRKTGHRILTNSRNTSHPGCLVSHLQRLIVPEFEQRVS